MKKQFHKFLVWMNGLKHQKKALIFLIALNAIMAVASNIVDWPWLTSVPWYLMPFTPICSIYPLTLAIWFALYARGTARSKTHTSRSQAAVPPWFTAFIFIGIVSYGIMAWFYFPAYMNLYGIHWRTFGNLFWVTVYALQALIIMSELKPLPILQYLPIFTYFFLKDYADRHLGTFIDILRPDFPEHLKNTFAIGMTTLHIATIALMLKISATNLKNYPSHSSPRDVAP